MPVLGKAGSCAAGCLVVLVVAIAGGLVAPGGSAGGSAAGSAGPAGVAIEARESPVQAGAWDVTVGGRIVIRIRAAAGGMSARERALAVAERLREGLEVAGAEAVAPAVVRGSLAVAAGNRLIVTADPHHAAANRSSRYELALRWANNIRDALGAPVLPGKGGHLVSIDGERVRSALVGRASWYGERWHGRPTATGEVYDQNSLTAAHRTLPFGTLVRVTNLFNGKQVTVRINNRGPYVAGRDIDLSRAAAEAIDLIGPGVAPVAIEVLSEK